jgi:hypothetical protein
MILFHNTAPHFLKFFSIRINILLQQPASFQEKIVALRRFMHPRTPTPSRSHSRLVAAAPLPV